jgi:hypothetical protein
VHRCLRTSDPAIRAIGGTSSPLATPAAPSAPIRCPPTSFDVATGKQTDKAQVMIVDGRIPQVGKVGDAIPAGATRVDLPGPPWDARTRHVWELPYT